MYIFKSFGDILLFWSPSVCIIYAWLF